MKLYTYLIAFFVTFSMGVIAMDTGAGNEQCPWMVTLLLAREKNSTRKPAKKQKWACEPCNKSFASEQKFATHLCGYNKEKIKPGINTFICNGCKKPFNGIDVLRQHMQTHINKKISGDTQTEKKRQRDVDVIDLYTSEAVSLEKRRKIDDSDAQQQKHAFVKVVASQSSNVLPQLSQENMYQPNVTYQFYYCPRIVQNIIVHKPS